MKIKVTSLLLFFLLSPEVFANIFPIKHTYFYNIFGSEQACRENKRRNPVVNCYQFVNFNVDGSTMVLLTDTPNLGFYNISGNKINIQFSIQSDAPKQMIFNLSNDETKILNLLDGHIWLLKQ